VEGGHIKYVQSITYSTTIATPNQKDWDGYFVEWLQVLMSDRKIALRVYRLTFDFNSFNFKSFLSHFYSQKKPDLSQS
jgi:hypothetical protein